MLNDETQMNTLGVSLKTFFSAKSISWLPIPCLAIAEQRKLTGLTSVLKLLYVYPCAVSFACLHHYEQLSFS